jgi:hypothetical protein
MFVRLFVVVFVYLSDSSLLYTEALPVILIAVVREESRQRIEPETYLAGALTI